MEAVAHLVGEDGQYLLGGHGGHEGIVEDDGLHLPEAREVGVGLGGTAAGVHDLDGPDLIAVLLQQLCDALLQLPVGEGRELVEDAAEEGVEEGEEQDEQGQDHGEGQDEPVAHGPVGPGDEAADAAHEAEADQERLELVPPEGLLARAVEAVLLLDVHGVMPGEGDEQKVRQGGKDHDRDPLGIGVFGEEARGGEGGVSVEQDEREIDDEGGRLGEDAPADLLPVIGLPFQVRFRIVHVGHVLGDRVAGGAIANDVQKQLVQIHDEHHGDGKGFEVHDVVSL